MNRTARTFIVLSCCAVASGGCGPSATFVSAAPPPGQTVEARFTSGVPAVTAALRTAMNRADVTPEPGASGQSRLVGVRQQVPYVGEGAEHPAPGALPVYRVVAIVTGGENTRVSATLDVLCPACDGVTPYEWEYPTDLLRSIIEGTREVLRERGNKVTYPARHRPARWRPELRP